MKKIGILTLFNGNYNYGGVLQAYALCKFVNDLGYKCEIISYKDSFNPIYPSLREQIKQYNKVEILKKTIEQVNKKFPNKKFKEIFNVRVKLINDFKDIYIPHTIQYSYDNLKKNLSQFDVLISGSDQVWNPNCSRRGFLQMFQHDSIQKVSYAASISRNSLSEKEKKIMIPAINDFDFIGVREKTAKEILKNDILKDIAVTCDPTLLLSKEEWEKLTKKNTIKEDYALCYFFSNSIKHRKIINEICKEDGIRLVYIPFAQQAYNKFDEKGKGTMIEDVSPQDFLTLINNAKYIFTDSFHGAIFSIIFEKQFLVFERSKNTKVSMNSRLYDLMEKVGLSDRIITENDKLKKKINEKVEFKSIQNKLKEYKEESIIFLKKSLE